MVTLICFNIYVVPPLTLATSLNRLFKEVRTKCSKFLQDHFSKMLAAYFQWPGFEYTFNYWQLLYSWQNLKGKKCAVSLHSRDDPGFWPETTDCYKIAFALLFKSWAKWKTSKLRPNTLFSFNLRWYLDIQDLDKAQPHCNKGKSINHNYIKRERKKPNSAIS